MLINGMFDAPRWRKAAVAMATALLGLLGACGGGDDPAAPAVIARVEISPKAAMLQELADTTQFSARAYDADGNPVQATFTWTSVTPDAATVDANGLVSAAANLGSTQIIAQAQGVSSPPAVVLIAQPAANAVQVSDSQILGLPVLLDPTVSQGVGVRYQVRIAGIAPPQIGELLLGIGEIPMGGKVVDAQVSGSNVLVTLETVPFATLFAALEFKQTLSLANAPVTFSDEVLANYDVARLPDGSYSFTGKPRQRANAQRSRPLAVTGTSIGDGFICKIEQAGAASGSPLSLGSAPFVTATVDGALEVDYSAATGLKKLVSTVVPKAELKIEPVLKAALGGKVECTLHLYNIPLPIGGPLAMVFGGWLGVNGGFELSGSVSSDLINLGAKVAALAKTTLSLGVQCLQACGMVHSAVNHSEGSASLAWPTLAPFVPTIDLGLEAFAGIDLAFGNQWLAAVASAFQFEAFKAKAGVKQELKFASMLTQAQTATLSSGFGTALAASITAGSAVENLKALLNIQFANAGLTLSVPLATSPKGSLTVSPNSVQAGAALGQGEKATFTVQLDKSTYLGIEAIDGIEIHRLKDGALSPAQPACATMAAQPGQTTFTCETDFLFEHAGTHDFVAFYKGRLFGVPLPHLFEVGNNAVATLSVGASATSVKLFQRHHDVKVTVVKDHGYTDIVKYFGSHAFKSVHADSVSIDEAQTMPTVTVAGVGSATQQYAVSLNEQIIGTADNVLGINLTAAIDARLAATVEPPSGGEEGGFNAGVLGRLTSSVVFDVVGAPTQYTFNGTAASSLSSSGGAAAGMSLQSSSVGNYFGIAAILVCKSATLPVGPPEDFCQLYGADFSQGLPLPKTGTLQPGRYAVGINLEARSPGVNSLELRGYGYVTQTLNVNAIDKANADISISFSPVP